MNLYGLGLSTLNTAQNKLTTSGHNISNADVEGYNRQSVLVETKGAHATGAGFIGRGAQAVTVQRAYDSFLHNQLVQAKGKGEALQTYSNEISQLNDLFADRTVGISPAIQKFFDSVQAVASTPADPAARQEMIGRADSLATQFNEVNNFINKQREDINTQLDTTVDQVNSYLERIHDANQQIVKARASGVGNHEPNDLLDQREQLVAELQELVDVKVLEQDGNFSLTLGSGQILLGGPTMYPLHAEPSELDPTRTVIHTTSSFDNGKPVLSEIDDNALSGGKLGGLLKYRAEALDQAQNNVGRLTVGIAEQFNALHNEGVDLNGEDGADFFKDAQALIGQVVASSNNSDNEDVTFEVELTDSGALTGSDYEIRYTDDDGYEIRTLPKGSWEDLDSPEHDLDGLSIRIDSGENTPADGDSWRLSPTRNAADAFGVEITDPAKIAAAGKDENGDPLGSANGDNALKLADLQTIKTMGGGNMNFNDAYSQIVNRVAVDTQQNDTALKAQENLIEQNYSAQQAVSGVDLNEEYLNLDRFMDQYRAASRMIDVGSTLFDTLLGLRA